MAGLMKKAPQRAIVGYAGAVRSADVSHLEEIQMPVTNDNQEAWSQAERDSVALPLISLMHRLDAINPLWTRFSVTRGADGVLHIELCDVSDTGH